LLYELVLPDIWAVGVKEALVQENPPREPVFVFADEVETWAAATSQLHSDS
jgi:hypothetical protein